MQSLYPDVSGSHMSEEPYSAHIGGESDILHSNHSYLIQVTLT